MLDGEVRNAAPRIESIRRGKGRGRTGIEAGMATAATIRRRFVRRQVERGENGAEKQPRAEIVRHDVGMFALPAQARFRGQRLFHHRRGVDKDLHVAAGIGDQPACNFFQTRLDQFVIVVAFGIDRNRGAVALLQDRQRIFVRPVIHAEHDHRADIRPQSQRRTAPLGGGCQPDHVAMRAVGDELLEPCFGFRHRFRPCHANSVEAAQARLRN